MSSQKRHRGPTPYQTYGVVSLIALVVVFGAFLWVGLAFSLITWWLASGIVTWLMYAFDKKLSKGEGRMRVPELILLGLVVLGGWFGGLIALGVPGHKTNHPPFMIMPIIMAVVHIVVATYTGWW